MSLLNTFLDRAQLVRQQIQERMGSSGNIISTSDINRGLRAQGDTGSENGEQDELGNDMKKFFYTGPADFFRNHKKNMEAFIEKHISQPIDKLKEDFGKD